MIRVAVVGTSNIGAVKFALPQIANDWPELSVACFGLPGGKFNEAFTVAGVFGPDPADNGTVKLSRRVNGRIGIDLTEVDHVLAMADSLGMPQTLFTAINYDIAEWPTRRAAPLLSEAAFHHAMTTAIAERADHLAHQFTDIPRVHVALAPYPTTAVVPRGPLHQQPYAAMATYPEADRLHALYRAALSEALSARGMTLIAQPDETIAHPFLTRPEYGIGAQDFRNQANILDDHRHMNARFGASLFRAFALGLSTTGAMPQDHTA